MIIGFTGTQEELQVRQVSALGFLLGGLDNGSEVDQAHHGDCVGGDAAFDRICQTFGFERHAHPGPDTPMRAHCQADVVYDELPFLERNRVIVDTCDLLIACPKGPETRRSGTWSTVRYARKVGRRIIFVWPDGTVANDDEMCPATGGEHVWTNDVDFPQSDRLSSQYIPPAERWHCDECGALMPKEGE